ncbi:MAG TPA: polyhydroxyalkanoic acid system family protein [Phenylobacterium sp.]
MTQPITVNIPHKLGVAEAKRRIERGFGELGGALPGGGFAQLKQSWTGDQMNFSAQVMGQSISGTIDVLAEAVNLKLVLPPLLAMIAGKIKGRLQKEGTLLLEKK